MVGAGGGGLVVAHELVQAGIEVGLVDAGPWLDPDRDYDRLECNMGSMVSGRLRWGPGDRSKPPWMRQRHGVNIILQAAGVGGTTRHYNAIAARAYRDSVTPDWPLSYSELAALYEEIEDFLPVVAAAPFAPKDLVFGRGCRDVGLRRSDSKDIAGPPSWGASYNAILSPTGQTIVNGEAGPGCTMCGHCFVGCSLPADAPPDRKAKRSTDVAFLPPALRTGRLRVLPDAFATRVLFDDDRGKARARGIRIRSTVDGTEMDLRAEVVVIAGGSIESPRLWLQSGLPNSNDVVGRYLTNHYQDVVTGFMNEEVNPDVGMVTMAKADFPGYGRIWAEGIGPWGFSVALTAAGGGFWSDPVDGQPPPWDFAGRGWGTEAMERLVRYSQALTIVLSTDDEERSSNRVSVAEDWPADEHGLVASVSYLPTDATRMRRDWLAVRAAEILRAAGAVEVHRSEMKRALMAHIMGTMRMSADPKVGVVDGGCEAHEVSGLFVGDSSVLPNGLGGAPPTLTTQALALRTARTVLKRYFS